MENLSVFLKNDEKRILLRSIEAKDAEFLMELNNDLDIAKYVVGTPKIVTFQEQMQWMEKIKLEKNVKRFMVEHDGIVVGTVIILSIDNVNLTARINIKLHKSAHGKGIGKASIMLALSYCFDTLGLMCVTANVLSYNRASLALFKSCGFTNEGTLRSRVVKNGERCDLVSFSIMRNEVG